MGWLLTGVYRIMPGSQNTLSKQSTSRESTKSVWNDTLEPDQYDLASTIQRAHAMNHTEYLSTLSQKRKRPLNSPPQPLRRSLPPSQPAISETSRQPIPTASPLQPRALPPDSVVWFGNGPPLDSQRLTRPIRSELSASPTRPMRTIGSPSSLPQPSRSTMLPSAYREKGLSRVQSIRDALAVIQSPDHFEERAPHPSSLLTPALSVSLPTAVSDLSRKAGSHFEQPTFDPGEDERSPHKSTTPSQYPLDVLDNDTQAETRMLVNSHPTVAQNTPHISPVPQTFSPTITPPGPDQQPCNDFGSSEDWPEDEKETARLETAAVEYLRTCVNCINVSSNVHVSYVQLYHRIRERSLEPHKCILARCDLHISTYKGPQVRHARPKTCTIRRDPASFR